MAGRTYHFRSGRALGSWLAAFALLVAGQGVARAGCDHGNSQTPELSKGTAFNWLSAAGALPNLADSDRPLQTDPQAPRPCSGPSCSGGSNSSLPSVPVIVLVDRADQWAHLALDAVASEPPGRRLVVQQPLEWPAPVADSLFHPPRRCAA